jgi:hypothetical protein
MISSRDLLNRPSTPFAGATPEHDLRVPTATLLIALPVCFTLFYALLQVTFNYPAILRQPAPEVLRQFQAGGPKLVAVWYGFALTPLRFLAAAALLEHILRRSTPSSLVLATPLAIAATLVQVLGLLRWPFLVPELARTVNNPTTDDATRVPPWRSSTRSIAISAWPWVSISAISLQQPGLWSSAWPCGTRRAFRPGLHGWGSR